MALEFRHKMFHMPSRKAQYAIAFAALLVVLAAVLSWMFINHKLSQMNENKPGENNSTGISITDEFTSEDKSNLLVIFTDEGSERFILLQADPQNNKIKVASVPSTLHTQDGITLTALYRKHGAARAVRAVADSIDLPLRHYIAVSGEKAVSWFNHLEGGLLFTLPEPVDHTADDGTITRLTAGEHNLTAAQTVGMMRYDAWQDSTLFDKIGAQIVTNMLNQYMRPDRYLEGDFAALSNLAQTSLRIGDYNEARTMLAHLANGNTGDLASVVTLPTISKADGLALDLNKIKQHEFFHDR